jgi:3-deoxy-D-manno-octulosonic-acid transferase
VSIASTFGRYALNAIYLVVLLLLLPLIAWIAVRHGKYREGWSQKLFGRVPRRDSDRRCIWFHAVSVGEVNLLRTVLPAVRQRFSGWDIVVSTTTKTGFELLKTQQPELLTFYCPLDFTWAVAAAMRRIRPSALVLTELEVWPNLIDAAEQSGAEVALINARLSEKSHRGYCRVRWFMKRVLQKIDMIAVQDEQYRLRFLSLGADPAKIHVTGSIKFDGAETQRANSLTLDLARRWDVNASDVVLLAGSTQAPEERLAFEAFRELKRDHPEARLVLVPRHPQRFDEVAKFLDDVQADWIRRSMLDETSRPRTDVLLVDTIGELRGWWGLAHAGFVGGSLGSRGGQNMIEPAAFGVPVCFGPQTQNFRDVVQMLLAADAAKVIQDGDELRDFWRKTIEDSAMATTMGQRARQVVLEQQGATKRTIDWLSTLLGPNEDINVDRAA